MRWRVSVAFPRKTLREPARCSSSAASDMHSGNLGLVVQPGDLAKGRFSLAPVYDMLPMRWRPDAVLGGAPDYAAFEPDASSASSPAATPAREFWTRLSSHKKVSPALRRVASEMSEHLQPGSSRAAHSRSAPG